MMNTQQIHDALLDVGQRNVRDGAEDKENENEQVDNANGFGGLNFENFENWEERTFNVLNRNVSLTDFDAERMFENVRLERQQNLLPISFPIASTPVENRVANQMGLDQVRENFSVIARMEKELVINGEPQIVTRQQRNPTSVAQPQRVIHQMNLGRQNVQHQNYQHEYGMRQRVAPAPSAPIQQYVQFVEQPNMNTIHHNSEIYRHNTNQQGIQHNQQQRIPYNQAFGHTNAYTFGPRPNFGPSSLDFGIILEKVPDLQGTEGADGVKKFFKMFDLLTDEWPDAPRIRAMESKVFGRAERAFEAARNTQPFRYASIKREMINQLEETDAKNLNAFDELMTGIRRGSSESIDDLANRIAALVRRAYTGLPQHLSDEYAIKFLIRAIGNPEIALNLELIRSQGMSLDHFVSLAARAESTLKATKRLVGRGNGNESAGGTSHQNFRPRNFPYNSSFVQTNSYGQMARNHEYRPQQQFNQRNWNCFNCNQPGHLARDCQYQSQMNQGLPQFRTYGNNVNRVEGTRTPNFENVKPTISNNFVPGTRNQPQSKNFLKQNCLVIQEEDVYRENAFFGKIGSNLEIENFIEQIKKNVDENLIVEIPKVGKVMVIKVDVLGERTKAMLDGGAQISVIDAAFLYKLMKNKNLNANDLRVAKSETRISDANGNPLACLGVVCLPILRNDCTKEVQVALHIAQAPIGFDLLFGTNALSSLGFKLFDDTTNTKINFEEVQLRKSDSLTVIYQTILAPQSTQIVELGIKEEFEGKDLFLWSEGHQNFRIEPTVGIGKDGKVIVPMTNFSSLSVKLEPGNSIGKNEVVSHVEECENFLAASNECFRINATDDQNVSIDKILNEILEKRTFPESEKQSLLELLSEFKNIFAVSDSQLTQTTLVQHEIETGSFPCNL
ncbi:hypothetical protein niasHS_015541 [Heterodera schachtii]|uniref:CCHC-type domain-containing protein n=1 Tax=Heterodera schachtii TaxID=97005 RepID=A0ABD2I3K4_HETSC